MGIFSKLLGGATAEPIKAVGSIADELFTSDDERLDKQALLTRIAQRPHLAQARITLREAAHRTVFVAGWRPFIGWVCGWNLLYLTFLRDLIVWGMAIWSPEITELPPAIGLDLTVELVIALLGLGTLRTVEKLSGAAK